MAGLGSFFCRVLVVPEIGPKWISIGQILNPSKSATDPICYGFKYCRPQADFVALSISYICFRLPIFFKTIIVVVSCFMTVWGSVIDPELSARRFAWWVKVVLNTSGCVPNRILAQALLRDQFRFERGFYSVPGDRLYSLLGCEAFSCLANEDGDFPYTPGLHERAGNQWFYSEIYTSRALQPVCRGLKPMKNHR